MKKAAIGINSARVLRTLWLNKSMSRIQLSRYLGLDKSTISKIINDLLDFGVVEMVYEGNASPNGGRRPIFLELNRRFGAVLGIEIQTDFYFAVMVDLTGKILFHTKQPHSRKDLSIAQTYRQIYEDLQPQIRPQNIPLIGAVVGVAGIVDPYRGVVFQSNPLNISKPLNVYREIDRVSSVPVLIENDANCGAWGEIAFNKHEKKPRDFIFILGETRSNSILNPSYKGIAIGTSIALDQKVRYGQQYSAGEFQSVFRTGSQVNQFSISDQQAERYEEDPSLFAQVAQELSRNIAFIVNMMNLQEVILSGRMEYHPEILAILQDEIRKNWSYPTPVETVVRFSKLEEHAVAYGAAGMFLEQLFGLPDAASPVDALYRCNLLRLRSAEATGLMLESV